MKRSEAFPSNFLGKDDVATPIVVTIDGVHTETVKSEGKDESKSVMTFRESIKPMILNLTNWMILEESYGQDSDDWAGHPVELYHDPSVMFGGKRVGGVRVRIPVVQRGATAPGSNYLACLNAAKQIKGNDADAKAHVAAIVKEAYPDVVKPSDLTPAMWSEVLDRINAAPIAAEDDLPF